LLLILVLMNNRAVRRAASLFIVCLSLLASGMAVRQIVVIAIPQPAQQVEGIVLGPSDDPISGMTVSDCSQQWTAALRTTTTDNRGHFRFSKQPGKTLYYLRFDHPLWNPLELKLKLDKRAHESGITAKPQIGG
jgi:hypothetical protein